MRSDFLSVGLMYASDVSPLYGKGARRQARTVLTNELISDSVSTISASLPVVQRKQRRGVGHQGEQRW